MKPSSRDSAHGAEIRDAPASDTVQPREVSSEALFEGGRVVLIRHADAIYTLRRTANGKLILTK